MAGRGPLPGRRKHRCRAPARPGERRSDVLTGTMMAMSNMSAVARRVTPTCRAMTRRGFLAGAAAAAVAAAGCSSGSSAPASSAASAPVLRCPQATAGDARWSMAARRGLVYGSSTATWQIADHAYRGLYERESAMLFTEDDLLWWRLRPHPGAELDFS